MVTALALSLLGPGALVAAGDDGPSRPLATDRPTRTSIRPTELSEPRPLPPSDKAVILLVSGIGSAAADGSFDALVAALYKDPRYEIHRFGGHPAYPYNTLGSIDESADQLTAEIRELAKTHPRIDIVAHSMGGVVVDAAFRRGLGAADKVQNYIALASPHDGSTLARVGETFVKIADRLGIKTEFRDVTARLGHDIGARAVRDLAETHAAPPPPGVNRIDVRVATDAIVIQTDARTPGVTTRTLLPTTGASLEGHGGATIDSRALAIVMSTIASRPAAPTGWRERVLEGAANAVSTLVDNGAPWLYWTLAVACLGAAACLWMHRHGRRTLGIP